MKNLKLINLLLIVATSLLLVNCTTDPIPGPDGKDGIDGIDGVDGATGTTECAACHNIAKSEAVHASYLFSQHAKGETLSYGTGPNRASCSACHTSEGYIDYVNTGAPNELGYVSPTAISCKTCHDTHTTFDFENEGFDYALRLITPVDLIINANLPAPIILDFEGTSNNCAQCHQPRREAPIDDGSGIYEVYNRYGPHHGPQSTFLEGIEGGEIAGFEYPAAGSAIHRTGSSCTSCHMGEDSGNNDGNHSWIPTTTSCTQCHDNITTDSKGNPAIEDYEERMANLKALLTANGLLDADGRYVRGDFPIAQAQALWNYILIEEDASRGTHNPNYAKALIDNSIEALSAD